MANISMQRKLRAIFSADVKGYSKLMGEDDEHTINTITAYRKIIVELIETHHGRVVDAPGDNILAEFSGALNAVNSAIAIQKRLEFQNSRLPENRRMDFRIGINLGDIVHREDRIYGDGVNVAARIESLADPGGICISRGVFDQVKQKVQQGFEYLGEHSVKNISEPVRIYRILLAPQYKGKVIGEPAVRSKKLKIAYTIAACTVLIFSMVLIWIYYPSQPDTDTASIDKMAFPIPNKPSIAILPFKNISADSSNDFLSDGITENLITALSKLPKLFIIAKDTTFSYKGKATKIQYVAEDLGVKYVLEGSLQKSGEKVRISVQLVDAISGHHQWSEKYDRDLRDLFSLQDEITKEILTAVEVKLSEGEQARMVAKGTRSLSAYLKILQANHYRRMGNAEDNTKARRLAEEAIILDPNYAMAYATLSRTHVMDVLLRSSKSQKQSLETAVELAKKALLLDDSLADAYDILGSTLVWQKKYAEGLLQLERALELEPNGADIHAHLGLALYSSNRPKEAILAMKKAIRLNPTPPGWYLYMLAVIYNSIENYDEAVAWGEKAIEQNPKDLNGHVVLCAAYSSAGRMDDARRQAVEVLRINPKYSVVLAEKTSPQRNQDVKRRYFDALRKAGLPEYPPNEKAIKPSIAVLPFKNMSGDPDQQYFSDGITEQIITSISKVPYISVIARQSSFAFRDSKETVQQIANKLSVRYILEGSLQRSDDRLRINIQLIDAGSGHHIWADHYDREINDIFAVQDEICKNIMVALQVKLTAGEAARLAAETTDIKAYEKFLQGMENYVLRTKESALIARQLFQEAIDLDPRYAIAYVMIGWIHLDDVWLGRTKTPANSITKAEAMAQKAISIHSTTTNENALLTGVHVLKRSYDQALAYGEKAVEQCPNCAGAQNLLGVALRYKGRYDEAILRIKKAIRLEPVTSIGYLSNLAWAYLYSGQYEQAISTWKKTLARSPDSLGSYMGLTAAYWWSGSEDQAREAARHVLRLNPQFSTDYWEKLALLEDKELSQRLFSAWRQAGLQ
jgi:adenylate cyclase